MIIKRRHWALLLALTCSGVPAHAIGFRGSAPLLTGPLGGQVAAAFDAFGSALPRHNAGQVRIPAVSGEKRSVIAPSIPTFQEAGYQP
jgi:tripartite-type tricarboxylate transporter receptor subunit TctC